MKLLLLAALSLLFAAPALASGGAVNLRIYPGMLKDLHAAAHPSPHVKGPLLGYSCQKLVGDSKRFCGTHHIYYARYRGQEYAVADFWGDRTGSTDQPERFKRAVGGKWKDVGDSGDPIACLVPAPVAKVWGMPPCPR
jgi:hypothetical protein